MRLFILLGSLLLAACGKEPPDYFPLTEGLHWEYRVVTTTRQGVERSAYAVDNLGQTDVDDEDYWLRRSSTGIDYYLQRDASGIYRSGKRTLIEYTPRWDERQRYVLKQPFTVQTQWEAESHPYILQRLHPFEERFTRSLRFLMNYRIEAIDETVTVPAGTFEHCLKVRGEAVAPVLADPAIGVSEVPVTTEEWYAPGVGLVRLLRREELNTAHVFGGEIVMELTAFTAE